MPPTGDCGFGSPLQDFQQRLIAEFRGTLSTTPIARDEGRAFDDSEGGRPSWRCRLSLPTCCEMLRPPPRHLRPPGESQAWPGMDGSLNISSPPGGNRCTNPKRPGVRHGRQEPKAGELGRDGKGSRHRLVCWLWVQFGPNLQKLHKK